MLSFVGYVFPFITLYTLGNVYGKGGRITAVVYDTRLRRFVVMHYVARYFWFG